MVDGDHHNVAFHAHVVTVIGHLLDGGTGKISAAVEPHDDRLLRILVQSFRPDVQILAVLVHGPVAVGHQQLGAGGVLRHQRADEAIGGGVLDPLPLGGNGHLEPIGVGVGNTLEYVFAVVEIALQLAGGCPQHRHIVITECLNHCKISSLE